MKMLKNITKCICIYGIYCVSASSAAFSSSSSAEAIIKEMERSLQANVARLPDDQRLVYNDFQKDLRVVAYRKDIESCQKKIANGGAEGYAPLVALIGFYHDCIKQIADEYNQQMLAKNGSDIRGGFFRH